MSVQSDLELLYANAKELVAGIERAWEEAGRPLTTEGGATGKAEVPHPLVKMLQEARRDVDRFARQLESRHAGPQPKAVVSRSIGKSPATKLRSVK